MKDDTISRAAALDALGEEPLVWCDGEDEIAERDQWRRDVAAIKALPSAQPGQRNARVFQGIIVEYPSISAYPEYEGKPYFSIKYTENGQEFIGYGTYKPEVLSEFLKEYFMLPTQPGWIPVTERLPNKEEKSYWVCLDGGGQCQCRWTNDMYGLGANEWSEWGWHVMDKPQYSVIVAWMPLPEPYREERTEE